MFDHCQPVIIDNLYGSLNINTKESSSCIKPRQWYFFYNYGYSLLIRFINITHLLSNSYVFKIYSDNINKSATLIYDSTNNTIANNEMQFDINSNNSGILVELIPINYKNMRQTSFIIDYVFRATSQSRYGRQLLQDNSSSFNASQPSFIVLICIIAVLVIAIIVTTIILCYRQHSKKRYRFRRNLNNQHSNDQTHLAASRTPSSISPYSIRSSRHLCSNRYPHRTQQQTPSLGQSMSTMPSMIPSHRLQQSIIDAYLNDLDSIQPTTINPKQLSSYLFIDLHSTSSETFPEITSKQYQDNNNNNTTSGYDTSTGGEDRYYTIPLEYRHHHHHHDHHHRRRRRRRRRRRYSHHQRQRRRSVMALKRSRGARFLMREKSLPNTQAKLPQLRRQTHLLNRRDVNTSSTTSNTNQDRLSTNLSITTDDYAESHTYHVSSNRMMNVVEEEKAPSIRKTSCQRPYLFEIVSTNRGDDSDMPYYEITPRPMKSSSNTGDGIAYVNDSIIV